MSPERQQALKLIAEGHGSTPNEQAIAAQVLAAQATIARRAQPQTIAYFLGVWPHDRGSGGHYVYLPNGRQASTTAPRTPWHAGSLGYPISDGILMSQVMNQGERGSPRWQPEGVPFHRIEDGWTVLAYWDRSGDPRHGSIAAFAFQASLGWIEAERCARELFPAVWARLDRHLGRTQASDDLRGRVIQALAEAGQDTWLRVAGVLGVSP